MGLKKAAVARLCLNSDIYRSMPEVCVRYLPAEGGALPAPLPIAPAAYTGGDIWLVEGSTGRDRLCTNYDATRQRCRMWAGVVMHHHTSAAPKKGLKQKHEDAVPTNTTASQPEKDKS
jgi:hypothetical protein